MTPTPADLAAWLPLSLKIHGPEPFVEWCRCAGTRFKDPFYDQTLQILQREPFHLLFRHHTPLSMLAEVAAHRPGLAPSGFIYHLSRCGSTLVSQMLAALPEHLVLSEPPPFDGLLRLHLSEEQRIHYLRAWISAISPAGNGHDRLFVKLDAWHTPMLPLLHAAFPDTPWIFLHRDPVEVMVSAQRAPGMHMVPNLLDLPLTGLSSEAAAQMSQTEYGVHILASILRNAVENLKPLGGIAVDYTELPEAVFTRIAPHFRLTLSEEQKQLMREKTAFHAKTPQLYFEPDSQEKQREADADLRQLCDLHLAPLRARLRHLA
jgi:hypothetical protein